MELSARAIALRSVLVAIAIFVTGTLAQGVFGWWTLAAGLLALMAAVIFFRDSRPLRKRVAVRHTKPSAASQVAPRVLLTALPDPAVLVDRRGIVVNVNAAACALLPLLKEARPLAFVVRAPAVLDGIEAVLRGGEAVETEFREHGAVERTLMAHIGPLAARDGAVPDGAVLVIRDVTSERRLEHMRVDFVANASHELRTPLASLIGFIETLQGPARDDEAARERFLMIMRDQARRMSRLIDDLLSLSRIEMNLHVPPSGTVEMALLVRHVVETLAPLAQERGVTVALETASAPLFVTGDRDDLLRVIENLVENAIKYGQSGRRVDVSLQRAEPPGDGSAFEAGAVLEVRDYGPGIAPEHLPRLTERFYRADAADSREKNGTGLGLAIVKHIVNRHRGKMEIASRKGEGAVFRVHLPGAIAVAEIGNPIFPPRVSEDEPHED